MQCPFCFNMIKEVYQCPECQTDLILLRGEGPTGTWECPKCSNTKRKVGYRLTPLGLMKVKDLVGRYAPKERR